MILKRIQALRGLDYQQLANLARHRGIIDLPAELVRGDWTTDRLRLAIVDSICDEELKALETFEARKKRLGRSETVRIVRAKEGH